MLDISNNGLESLEGIQGLTKLKRLVCKNNQISDLKPLESLTMLIDIDLENNPVDSISQVLGTILSKKDLLVFNLKLAPCMVKTTTI